MIAFIGSSKNVLAMNLWILTRCKIFWLDAICCKVSLMLVR